MSSTYNRKDTFYKKAKEQGYRSRASYKLIEINKKFKLLKPGTKVLDLGCWPGGWLQVASEAVRPNGIAVGIDLVQVDPISDPFIKTMVGDVADDKNIQQALEIAGGPFDVVVSDMSPKLSGIREADQAAAVRCGELAEHASLKALKVGGHLVIKVFKGPDVDAFIKKLKARFKKIEREELDSSRSSSNEYYLICQNLIG